MAQRFSRWRKGAGSASPPSSPPDAVGYSRLMAHDEHATVAALDAARDAFRDAIGAHRGRLIDMAGDSVLAVFETAAGAVSAALAAQQALEALAAGVPADRRMRFRIGVHLGDVIEKADGSIYGDGVNIAARLEGLAQPGGITVTFDVPQFRPDARNVPDIVRMQDSVEV